MKFDASFKKASPKAKWLCVCTAAGLLLTGIVLFALPKAHAATEYNFAEALQKSLYFYDAEKCGSGISGGKLEWRGDCHTDDAAFPVSELPDSLASYKSLMDPDGDGLIDLGGGYHDAGDHVRFGLPQSYAFATLGWGYNKFRDAFTKIGETEHMLDILKRFSDCYLKSIFRDADGKVFAFCFQMGDGDVDHSYWGPPEFQTGLRPAFFATAKSPASDISAGVAAGLAIMYLNYKSIDAEYAAKCLDYAIAMYEFATKYRGLGDSGGYYGSAYDEDELSWAAVWLYEATGKMNYIRDIDSVDASGAYTGYMKRIISTTTNTWQNIWTHCWDVVWAGTFTELAGLFPDNKQFDYFARWNLEYFSGGAVPHEDESTTYLKLTPAGYAMINTWGSARYNCGAQLCAMVYQKEHPAHMAVADWARWQMEYIMGNNPMGYSYIVGYGKDWAKHPHHRAAHGSTTNNMGVPAEHKHTLWGALVGGPDGDDVHKDETTDYVYNEVAIDYNAAFVGALAGEYLLYGGDQKPVANFPPVEARVDEFYIEGKVEQENKERTQVTVRIHNDSLQPPRFNTALSCRYYFNISEMLKAGQSIKDLSLAIMYDQVNSDSSGKQSTKVTGPIPVDAAGGIYYIQLDWGGLKFFGTKELQFALIAAQDSDYTTHWDPTNDWSRQSLSTTERAMTKYIPVYSDGEVVFGAAPQPGPSASPSQSQVGTPTPTPVASPALDVSYRCCEKDSGTNTIRTWLQVKNSGKAPLDLSKVKLRYWFTKDTDKEKHFSCDYTKVGSANITGSFKSLIGATAKADTYFELGFTGGAGTLGSGASTGDIQIRIYNTDYTPFDQANDYSFAPDILSTGANTKITGYIDGKLVYGVEP